VAEFVVGQTVRLSVEFRKADGTLGTPTTVTLHYQKGSATPTTNAAPTNDSTGKYHVDVELDTAGEWKYDWVSTGDPATVEEGRFTVRKRYIQT
jgi:hypothetical protein